MQSLSATITVVNTLQNPSVNKLHMVKAKDRKKGSATEDRSPNTPKSCYYCGATPLSPKGRVSH